MSSWQNSPCGQTSEDTYGAEQLKDGELTKLCPGRMETTIFAESGTQTGSAVSILISEWVRGPLFATATVAAAAAAAVFLFSSNKFYAGSAISTPLLRIPHLATLGAP